MLSNEVQRDLYDQPVRISVGTNPVLIYPTGHLAAERAVMKPDSAVAALARAVSLTTAESARLSAAILRREGIPRIALVTTARNMPRARAAFAAQGLDVRAVPCAYNGSMPMSWGRRVPGPEALGLSQLVPRE